MTAPTPVDGNPVLIRLGALAGTLLAGGAAMWAIVRRSRRNLS